MRKVFSLGSAAAAAVAAVLYAVLPAAAATGHRSAVTGTENFQVMSSSATARAGAVIAYGPITAAGSTPIGPNPVSTAVFPHGTITLVHRQGKGGGIQFDPRTCLLQLSQAGTYKLVHGTGAYARISGHGTYRLSIIEITARVKGVCSFKAPPVASQELIRLSGPVRL